MDLKREKKHLHGHQEPNLEEVQIGQEQLQQMSVALGENCSS